MLADADRADDIDVELRKLGYQCLHRSADAGNYQRGDERVDLIYARRPVARRLLAAATPQATAFGNLKVIGAEGLIAFKLQGIVNDPRRTQDLEDIRALLRANRAMLDLDEVRERVDHDPFEALDGLMTVVEALCPTWPERGRSFDLRLMRL